MSRSVFGGGSTSNAQTVRDIAAKNSGVLFKRGLEEMSKFLSGRAGAGASSWADVSVLGYYNQNILSRYKDMSERNQWELKTLSGILDCLRTGRLEVAADVAMGRFMAIETALAHGNWDQATHLVVSTPLETTSVPAGLAELAQKHEVRRRRLADLAKQQRE